jgi:hypothetical protein
MRRSRIKDGLMSAPIPHALDDTIKELNKHTSAAVCTASRGIGNIATHSKIAATKVSRCRRKYSMIIYHSRRGSDNDVLPSLRNYLLFHL